MEFVVDKIKALISANADSDGYVSLPLLEEKMKESGFDIESTGYSYDVLVSLLEDLDDFEIDAEQTPVRVRCQDFKPVESSPVISTSEDTPLKQSLVPTGEEDTTINRKITATIRKLLKYNPSPEGYLMLTTLGAELRSKEIRIPNGEKLSVYLRKYPKLFEMDLGKTFVRIAPSSPSSTPALAPSPSIVSSPVSASVPEKQTILSLYNIFDFCFFPDYSAALVSLAELAVPDGWFVMEDPDVKYPYQLVSLKLQLDFALLVKEQMNGADERFRIGLDKASFRTGFHTSEGAPIYACLTFNRTRGEKNWQSWAFDHFSVGEA